jgi:hypothetical protein
MILIPADSMDRFSQWVKLLWATLGHTLQPYKVLQTQFFDQGKDTVLRHCIAWLTPNVLPIAMVAGRLQSLSLNQSFHLSNLV